METHDFSARGLSRRANEVGDGVPDWRALHHDGDSVENWIRHRKAWRRPARPRYWLQVAAIAQTLELTEAEAQEFFLAAGWPLDGLRVRATTEQRSILGFGPFLTAHAGQPASDDEATGKALVPSPGALVARPRDQLPVARTSVRPRRRPVTIGSLAVGLVAVAGTAGVLVVGGQPPDPVAPDRSGSPELLADAVGGPVYVDREVGEVCLIELADMPSGPTFGRVEGVGGCDRLAVQNQYANFEGIELASWDRSTSECWTGPEPVTFWMRFQIDGSAEPGWLAVIAPNDTTHFRFAPDADVAYELRTEPDRSADVIDTYTYDQLAGRLDQIRFDMPVGFEPEATMTTGEYHFAGCWQEQPSDNARGLHFYWLPEPDA